VVCAPTDRRFVPANLAWSGVSWRASPLGLGLYIAHEIVAMHGGSMKAESSKEAARYLFAHLPRFQLSRSERRV
jgi:signal transduction histidine kinase